MANRKFVVDFDLNDNNYREKLERLISDSSKLNDRLSPMGRVGSSNLGTDDRLAAERFRMQQAQQDFYSRHSRQDIELSRRRVQAGPYAGLASEKDYHLVQQDDKFRQLSKSLEESTKIQRLISFEERSRHREYRTLTTSQLENERTKLRREALKDERERKFDDADSKRRDVSAIEQIINQRKGSSPEERAIRQFGQTFFMSEMMSNIAPLFGRGGQIASHGANMGMNAFGAMRMGGMGMGKAGLIGAAIGIADTIFGTFGDIEENAKALNKASGIAGSGDHHSYMKAFDSTKGFTQLAVGDEDFAKSVAPYLQRTKFGSTDVNEIARQIKNETVLEKTMGLSGGDLQGFYRYGLAGNMVDPTKGAFGMAQFLESKQAGQIKVGIAPDGSIGERNLARLPDYLKRLVELNESMYKITGERSKEEQNRSMNLFGSMIGMGGIFSNEDTAAETLQGIRGRFASPVSPLHQFKNIQAYRQVNGNTDLTSMMLNMEDMDNPDVINQSVRNLRGEFGFGSGKMDKKSDEYYFYLENLKEMMGFSSLSKTMQFDNQFGTEGMRKEDLSKFTEQDPTERLQKAGENFTTKLDEAGTELNKMLKNIGETFIPAVDKFAGAVNDMAKFINDFPSFSLFGGSDDGKKNGEKSKVRKGTLTTQ